MAGIPHRRGLKRQPARPQESGKTETEPRPWGTTVDNYIQSRKRNQRRDPVKRIRACGLEIGKQVRV